MGNSIFALITAAGNSSRMGGIKKELVRINNYPLIYHTAIPFFKSGFFKAVFVICRSDDEPVFREILESPAEKYKIPLHLISGGNTRQASVFSGLKAMSQFNPEIVLIHDGARPFVSEKIIAAVIKGSLDFGACAPVISVVDSLKTIDDNFFIHNHPDRYSYRAIQTPQGFNFKSILDSHIKAASDKNTYTDDTEIYSLYSGKVFTVEGSENNIKITYPEDIRKNYITEETGCFRIGQGYDIHTLAEDRPLVIGGVTIPSEKGSVAHSDGDVLYHAIIDSLFGAVSDGDIGSHFSPSDQVYKNINSSLLLQETFKSIKNKGFSVVNLDSTVILELPKLRRYIDLMRQNIAEILKIDIDTVSVKAKTKEKCDSTGEGKAVEAISTVLLTKQAVSFR